MACLGRMRQPASFTAALLLALVLGAFCTPLAFAEAEGSTESGAISAESTTIGRKPLSEDEPAASRKSLIRQEEAASDGVGVGQASGPAASKELHVSKKKKAGLVDAFVSSMSMILVTEIGDETFIIAALMAMRHSRSIVLAGALFALGIMTVLSTGLGMIVPNLISRQATNHAAAVLYTFFGLRLLYIAWRADPKDTPQKELEEVEEKLHESEGGSGTGHVEEKLEEDENGKGKVRAVKKFFSGVCTPVFLEAFILTFLAEWGDRSQIATITLAAHKNAIGVTVGAILGHVICTSLAVVGGRLLALKISQRTVAAVGGLLFLVFAVHSYISPIADD